MKICCTCKVEKAFDSFYKRASSKDGLQKSCIACRKSFNKKDYALNKEAYLKRSKAHKKEYLFWWNEFKSELKCDECKENHPAVLDFHHLNPKEKDYNISSMIRNFKSKENIIKEITKCIVLCSNCHRKLHWNMRR